MQVKYEWIFLRWIVVRWNEQTIEQGLVVRVLEDFRQEDFFALLEGLERLRGTDERSDKDQDNNSDHFGSQHNNLNCHEDQRQDKRHDKVHLVGCVIVPSARPGYSNLLLIV